MPSIGRGTLPQNFLDSASSGMALPQPEPQYFFAQMAIAGQLRAGAMQMGLDSCESFVKLMAQSGGTPVPMALEKMARAADAYPGAVMFVDAFGKNEGDTVKMTRRIYEGGGYTEADREVKAEKPTSTTGIAIKAEEVPVVLKQYEGPYDTGNSRVAPYAILSFDAKYKNNKNQLASETAHHLLRDYTKWLDIVIRDRFRASSNITYADNVSNVLSFTAGAGHSISLDTIMRARASLSDRERKPFPNGRYMAVVPSIFNVDMLQDATYRDLSAQHGAGKNMLFSYLASVQDVDIFESSTLKTYAAGVTVPNDGQVVPVGSTVYEGLLFGPDAVGFGQAEGPTVYDADDTDFKKSVKVIWRSTQAFQTLDDRGVQRILFQAA